MTASRNASSTTPHVATCSAPALLVIGAALLLALVLAAPTITWAYGAQDQEEAASLWVGPDGEQLPFRTYDDAKEFLRTAQVVSSEDFGVGITGLKRLVLERDGIRARGAFHEIDKVTEDSRVNGRMFFRYYDSYKGQCAAYELARVFELDNVPPTACRRVDGVDGSVQLWMEDTSSERDQGGAGSTPPVTIDWLRQLQTMRLFDSLIYNDDRNSGNYLVGIDWDLWMIDHSRAFQMRSDLRYDEEIVWCTRRMWQLLQQVTDDQIRDAVDPYLVSRQLNALIERRSALVEHIQKMIDERGEDAVIRD